METTPATVNERRQARRSHMKEGTYAAVLSDFGKVGTVLDMSDDGIAFKYLADLFRDPPFQGEVMLQLFHTGDPSHIKDIPFTVASDIVIRPMNVVRDTVVRRLGGRFGAMAPAQKNRLRRFIDTYEAG